MLNKITYLLTYLLTYLIVASAEPVTCRLLVHALLRAAPDLVDQSTGLWSELLGGLSSSEINPGVSSRKNSTIEHARSVGELSYNGATVSMETAKWFSTRTKPFIYSQ